MPVNLVQRSSFLVTLAAALLVFIAPAWAQLKAPPTADQVFSLSATRSQDGGLALNWSISPDTYMYREKFAVTDEGGNPVAFATPSGEWKDDPTFGRTEVYHNVASLNIDAAQLSGTQSIDVTYQGCADEGICYPPETQSIDVATLAISEGRVGLPGLGVETTANSTPVVPLAQNASNGLQTWIPSGTASASAPGTTPIAPSGATGVGSGSSSDAALSGGYGLMILSFLGLGLLLAFTPCIFPMIPILTGVLANSGKPISATRGFSLSLAYVVAMALAYAVIGMAAAWSGQNLQILLQNPIALGVMALVFVALALSMFGLYDLELPPALSAKLTGATNNKGGSVGGAMIMGFVAALIVGPCMTPPLAAALLYVAQSGDVVRGATALFALGFGMGLPLIVFGTFGSRLLPKPGPWLVLIKQVFGFVFIGLAIWMLARVIPANWTLVAWGGLAVGMAVWLVYSANKQGENCRWCGVFPVLGGAAGLAGLFLLAGPVLGPSYLPPIISGQSLASVGEKGYVQTVTTSAAFDTALSNAQAKGQPILVDFTASWCVSCAEIEHKVMNNPAIAPRLANVSVIKADLSNFTSESQTLMQRFNVVGPPTLFFVDPQSGQEISGSRSIGEIGVEDFTKQLEQAGA